MTWFNSFTSGVIGALVFLCLEVLTASPLPRETKEPPLAIQDADQDIVGVYLARTEDQGTVQHGAVTITRYGQVYALNWITGATISKGVGVRHRDVLAVSWWTMGEKAMRGATLYRIEAGKLTGQWAAYPGLGQGQRETLVFLRGLPETEDNR